MSHSQMQVSHIISKQNFLNNCSNSFKYEFLDNFQSSESPKQCTIQFSSFLVHPGYKGNCCRGWCRVTSCFPRLFISTLINDKKETLRVDKGSLIWTWNMKGRMQIQKAHVFYTCLTQPLTFINIFSDSAALILCLFRGTRQKRKQKQSWPLGAQKNQCLGALMSWYLWQWLAIWNFKPWRGIF